MLWDQVPGLSTELKVQGPGCKIQSSEFRVQSSEFRIQGSEFRVQSSGFRVQGSEFRVQSSGFRVLSSKFRVHVHCQVSGQRVWGSQGARPRVDCVKVKAYRNASVAGSG